jgi:hypothetical protein
MSNDLQNWAQEADDSIDLIIINLEAMMSKQMEEGKYYGEFYLNNADWNQVNDFHIKLIRLLDGTRIRDLLSSIIEGER